MPLTETPAPAAPARACAGDPTTEESIMSLSGTAVARARARAQYHAHYKIIMRGLADAELINVLDHYRGMPAEYRLLPYQVGSQAALAEAKRRRI